MLVLYGKINQIDAIFIIMSGTELVCNYKTTPYRGKEDSYEYKEALDNISDKISLLDVEGLGRLGYFICKDAINPQMNNILYKDIRCKFIFISAYSSSINIFSENAKSLSTYYHCTTLFANACAALDKKRKQVGFLANPIIDNFNSPNTSIMAYEKMEDCECDCTYCSCCCIYNINSGDIMVNEELSVNLIPTHLIKLGGL